MGRERVEQLDGEAQALQQGHECNGAGPAVDKMRSDRGVLGSRQIIGEEGGELAADLDVAQLRSQHRGRPFVHSSARELSDHR